MQPKYAIYATLVVFAVVFLSGCTQDNLPQPTQDYQQPVSASSNINVEKIINGEGIDFTYNCFWSGMTVKCNGEVKYVGPSDSVIDNVYIDLACRDTLTNCFYGADREDLALFEEVFKEGSRKTFTLTCDIGKRTDINVALEISGGAIPIYSNRCST